MTSAAMIGCFSKIYLSEVTVLKILELKSVPVNGKASVQFIRIDPEDISATLSEILKAIMDLSWLKNFDAESLARRYEQRAQITIADMRRKIENCDTGKLTKDAGEYVVSELAREAIVSELNYLDIPLAELLGKKISGNPGFDFHSQNNATNTVIFGEAKYVTAHSGYPRAIDQIKAFVDDKKDIADIADLRDFCSADALSRVVDGFKGFAAAFSAKSTPSDRLISAITAKDSFQELLKYEEVILVAVNL